MLLGAQYYQKADLYNISDRTEDIISNDYVLLCYIHKQRCFSAATNTLPNHNFAIDADKKKLVEQIMARHQKPPKVEKKQQDNPKPAKQAKEITPVELLKKLEKKILATI